MIGRRSAVCRRAGGVESAPAGSRPDGFPDRFPQSTLRDRADSAGVVGFVSNATAAVLHGDRCGSVQELQRFPWPRCGRCRAAKQVAGCGQRGRCVPTGHRGAHRWRQFLVICRIPGWTPLACGGAFGLRWSARTALRRGVVQHVGEHRRRHPRHRYDRSGRH